MLVNEKVTKEPIVDQLFYFLSPCSEGNMSMAYKWFKQSQITVNGKPVFKLQDKQKHWFL